VWLLSRTGEGARIQGYELGLPLIAGLGFGLFLVGIDHVSDAAILWPLAAARIASIAMLLAVLTLTRHGAKPALVHLPLMVLAGLCDTAGNACYALAAQVGRLDVAAVLSSLYPAATVLLAHFVLQEQLTRRQGIGVLAALLAVVLIAS